MSVETRLAREYLQDGATHVARFLVLWVVITVSGSLGLGAFGLVFWTGFNVFSLLTITTTVLLGAVAGLLPSLVLTIAWRSSEVAYAR
ncbi:hypothetical protein [Halorarius halobius]|uniref:hypothetical protein n=1 Tax=Halorarius halobius TaxID=2962671 RepID=UPI0020CC1793|nr:hypothetical protein [Halorarius halobius]